MLSFISVTALLSLLASASGAGSNNRLKESEKKKSDLCDGTVDSLSGYYEVDGGVDKNYFYWLFESRQEPATDPLIIWLTGGPGCSSQLALLSENGPCKPTADGLSTFSNPYSWNSNANIMWVDQPANVGYSYGKKVRDADHDEAEVSQDMFEFVQAFLTAHPEYLKNELFVFGESYGGHYAPSIAARIYQGNQDKEGLMVNLKGVGVGNGLTDPVIQYQYYPEMAMNNTYGIKTVSEEAYDKMVEHVPTCIKLAKLCQQNVTFCVPADDYCNLMETTPYSKTGLNPYDIRKPCEGDLCYDFDNIDIFLNLDTTREALGVSEKVKTWESCNTLVNIGFASDWMRNYQQVLVPMIEDGIRVLIYAGDVDFICNWIGNKAWTQALPWSGHADFNKEEDHAWQFTKDGEVTTGGYAKTAQALKGGGSLTFMQVLEAGHMVPMDQPEAALAMLNAFTGNKGFY